LVAFSTSVYFVKTGSNKMYKNTINKTMLKLITKPGAF